MSVLHRAWETEGERVPGPTPEALHSLARPPGVLPATWPVPGLLACPRPPGPYPASWLSAAPSQRPPDHREVQEGPPQAAAVSGWLNPRPPQNSNSCPKAAFCSQKASVELTSNF